MEQPIPQMLLPGSQGGLPRGDCPSLSPQGVGVEGPGEFRPLGRAPTGPQGSLQWGALLSPWLEVRRQQKPVLQGRHGLGHDAGVCAGPSEQEAERPPHPSPFSEAQHSSGADWGWGAGSGCLWSTPLPVSLLPGLVVPGSPVSLQWQLPGSANTLPLLQACPMQDPGVVSGTFLWALLASLGIALAQL